MAASDSTVKRVVMIAVDASEQAVHAVNFYVENLHIEENQVILLHVVQLPEMADMESMRKMMLSPHSLIQLWEQEQAESKKLEIKFKEHLRANGVENIRCKIEGGMKPGQVIVHSAQEEKVAMVIMGTRGMGTVRRTLLGSVSDYVVHHATCPVVVCRQ